MISTDPNLNKPRKCICAKCGKTFVKSAWSGAYSKRGNHCYKYENPDDFGLVVLCDSCSSEELKANRIGMIIY